MEHNMRLNYACIAPSVVEKCPFSNLKFLVILFAEEIINNFLT